MTDFQCFKFEKIKTTSAMHDLRAMCRMTLVYAVDVFRNDTDDNGNFHFYPTKARMSDLQVITLVITAKYACIDSYDWFFSNLRTD
jgi:hypothetical protein